MKETKGRRTLISNLANVLSENPSAKIVKAEYRYKALTSTEVTPIDTTTMLKSIESLSKNIVFTCCVDWIFENVSKTSKTEDFIVYGDMNDKIIGTVVVIHLKAINQNQVKQIEDELNKTIFQTPKENI